MTTIKVINQSVPAAVFVKGARNNVPHAIVQGYIRRNWSTAGHINMYEA